MTSEHKLIAIIVICLAATLGGIVVADIIKGDCKCECEKEKP